MSSAIRVERDPLGFQVQHLLGCLAVAGQVDKF